MAIPTNLLQMLEYATAVDDRELQEYIRKSFEWAKSREAGTSSLTGFIPETARDYRTSEGCAVADMVAWALKLSHFGVADYYEDAERWIRNFFSEIQMTPAKMDHMVHWGKTKPTKRLLYNETDDRVAERNIGGFGSWASGNEWLAGDERDSDNLIMHCCTGNATRSVFYAWRHILDYQDEQLQVNMLLNRASAWADIYSHIPYQGRVDIKMKKTCRQVLVHAPEWIQTQSDKIKVTVNGKPRSVTWQDRYFDCGKVKKGQTIVTTFPISEHVVTERMGQEDYTLIIKGNTIVHIDPPGRNCPLFRRAHYRENQTRWRQIERFVCDQVPQY
jgi:hypothetical protein